MTFRPFVLTVVALRGVGPPSSTRATPFDSPRELVVACPFYARPTQMFASAKSIVSFPGESAEYYVVETTYEIANLVDARRQ